jgi:hypothetical protein
MKVIPQDILNKGYNAYVHVEGWNKAACFVFLGMENGQKKLKTPKSNRIYYTYNNLLYTKRYDS